MVWIAHRDRPRWQNVESKTLLPTQSLDRAGGDPWRILQYGSTIRVTTVPRVIRRRIERVESVWGKLSGHSARDRRVDFRLRTRTTTVDALEVDVRVPCRRRGHRASLLAVDAEADTVAAHFCGNKYNIRSKYNASTRRPASCRKNRQPACWKRKGAKVAEGKERSISTNRVELA